jgi:hypothetical protein
MRYRIFKYLQQNIHNEASTFVEADYFNVEGHVAYFYRKAPVTQSTTQNALYFPVHYQPDTLVSAVSMWDSIVEEPDTDYEADQVGDTDEDI